MSSNLSNLELPDDTVIDNAFTHGELRAFIKAMLQGTIEEGKQKVANSLSVPFMQLRG